MGKTHRFSSYIRSIIPPIERNNARYLENSYSVPEDFTTSLDINGHIFVPNDKGFEFTQMVSAYTNGLDSNFVIQYSSYPSKSGVMLLGDVTIYYDYSTSVGINNSANLMILKQFENHKLTGSFEIIKNDKPGLTIISGYDQTNNNNSVYYNVTGIKSHEEKNIITNINSFDTNIKYNFELIRDSSFNKLKLKIKKSTDKNFSSSELLLDRDNNKRIGFLANNNIIISQIIMTNND